MTLSTPKNQEFLKKLIRKEFDKKGNNYYKCQKIIEDTEKLGIPSMSAFISDLKRDLQYCQIF